MIGARWLTGLLLLTSTTALATAVLAGHLEPTVLDLDRRPDRLGIRIASRFGERARFVLESIR